MEPTVSRVLIWDLPVRIFHWLLAGGFVAAAGIALLLGEDSPLFPYHAIIGLTMALMVCLRVAWGFIGSRYARFGSFLFGPRAVFEYTKGALFGSGKRHLGHNPGSAYAILAILALVIGLAVTGIVMGQGNESVEEIHELLAYILVGVVVVHVLGVTFHTVRHRENITASMVHGRKGAEAAHAIRSAHPVTAVVFVAITVGWAWGLLDSLDSGTQETRLPLIGTTLKIGEAEGGEHGTENRGRDGNEEHEDDD